MTMAADSEKAKTINANVHRYGKKRKSDQKVNNAPALVKLGDH